MMITFLPLYIQCISYTMKYSLLSAPKLGLSTLLRPRKHFFRPVHVYIDLTTFP
jgi:hypothetical protein